MNERIRELARKANMVEVEYSPGFPDIRYPANFEMFAELIIRECAKVAEKEQAFNARYTDADQHPQVKIDQCILVEFGL